MEVTGERVALTDRAVIDVGRQWRWRGSGGGDTRGANTDVQNAAITGWGPQATIRADATQSGDGGRVAVWGRRYHTRLRRHIARGAGSGAGGQIETRQHYPDVNVSASKSVPRRASRRVAVDPDQITIVAGGSGSDSNITSVTPFQPSAARRLSTLSTADQHRHQYAGGSVTIVTNRRPGPGNGDITFDASGGAIVIDKNTNTFSSTLHDRRVVNINFVGGPTTFRTSSRRRQPVIDRDSEHRPERRAAATCSGGRRNRQPQRNGDSSGSRVVGAARPGSTSAPSTSIPMPIGQTQRWHQQFDVRQRRGRSHNHISPTIFFINQRGNRRREISPTAER